MLFRSMLIGGGTEELAQPGRREALERSRNRTRIIRPGTGGATGDNLGKPNQGRQRQAIKSAFATWFRNIRASTLLVAVLTCKAPPFKPVRPPRSCHAGPPPQVRHGHARSAQDRPAKIFRWHPGAHLRCRNSLKSSPHRHRASACAWTLRRSAVSLAKVARQLNAALIWINRLQVSPGHLGPPAGYPFPSFTSATHLRASTRGKQSQEVAGRGREGWASRLGSCAVVSSTSHLTPTKPRSRSRSSLRMRFICADRISSFLRSRRGCSKASLLATA